ncbi:radical SAM protein [Tabrizicola sp.]|uniref:radical SAM protein n=1 Tax=Tabrizicola sp. TaxID=2005166 RepID=UPI002733825A|nr:radical SAM protein [Tabrizicola sp.]MDP3195599.1 radical SAM protein [Tabrizicola sp.]
MADPPTPPYDLIEHANADHSRVVLVDWTLGNACSYACSYCPKALHDGSVAWQRVEDVVDFYDQLHQHYTDVRGKRVWLQFTGGEPTMHPQIIRLLEAASAQGFSVSLISNGSRTLRFWEKIAPHLDSVILTYHNEFADLDHFRAVGRLLADRMAVHVNVTMRPDHFDRTLDEAQALREVLPAVSITLKPLRVGFGNTLFDYTPDQLAVMQGGLAQTKAQQGIMPRGLMTVQGADGRRANLRANEFVLQSQNRWRGYRCNAGLESLRVRDNGTVTRAVCAVGGDIGRLGGPIALPQGPILCTAEVCSCTADILITRARAPTGPIPAWP